ncbi:MAG: hypothetical protein M0P91_10800 [Sulfuricurvum sp.]|jgi:predicted Zn-dependent protease|uniref:hypothetical protein n=1 Tax=Sulfuricurvum sp. TaxID=2025608 RepID=UPI0025E400CD|nr:hypothetical protein [Sulfuricurvum sp.]MCK9373679.1 hypothetical protein [Sulfuricurvum sp.]
MNKILLAALVLVSGLHATPMLSKRVFEDTFILYAFDAQMRHKPHDASEYFSELYKRTSKKEYLYQSLRMLEEANELPLLSQRVKESLKELPEDEMLQRFGIIVLLQEGSFAEASQKGLELSNKTKKAPDYLLYAEARLKISDFEGTLSALKKAYDLTYDERTAERIALVYYAHMNQKKEGIQFLKEHISAHGNSGLIGKRLGSLYADSGALDDAAEIYAQTYELTKEAEIADEAVRVYLHTQKYTKVVAILEKSGVNDPMLLEFYVKEKEFNKASALAQKLYLHQNNPLYLAQSAVFMYEGAKDKHDAAVIAKVVESLKKATSMVEDPLYLNYLGYLMIDHDLNVTEGMGYVRRALNKQPDSPFYIDSLAWGNYKQGECAEALRLMKQVESMIGSNEQDVKEHLKAIEACKTKEKK